MSFKISSSRRQYARKLMKIMRDHHLTKEEFAVELYKSVEKLDEMLGWANLKIGDKVELSELVVGEWFFDAQRIGLVNRAVDEDMMIECHEFEPNGNYTVTIRIPYTQNVIFLGNNVIKIPELITNLRKSGACL